MHATANDNTITAERTAMSNQLSKHDGMNHVCVRLGACYVYISTNILHTLQNQKYDVYTKLPHAMVIPKSIAM